MAKLTLSNISSRYASVAALNANFAAIVAAIENTLSRDGTSPNVMEADIDLNSNNLLNVGTINGADATTLGASLSAVAALDDEISALATQTVSYKFSTTVGGEPSAGYIRFSDAAISSVVTISITNADAFTTDQSAYINTFDDSTNTASKGVLSIRTAEGDLAVFNVTAITDNTGWFELDVEYISHSGSFEADELCLLNFSRTGDVGAAGVGIRSSSTSSTSSITPDLNSFDQYCVNAQAVTLTINAPTGTLADSQKLIFRILDNGTSRTINWNATYTPIGVVLPTATTISKTTYVGCTYNLAATRWDVIAVATQV